MIVISFFCNGFVGLRNAGRCFSSALTATVDTLIAETDAGKRASGNNAAKQIGDTNRVPKDGLIIAIVSDSIAGDRAHPPNLLSKSRGRMLVQLTPVSLAKSACSLRPFTLLAESAVARACW